MKIHSLRALKDNFIFVVEENECAMVVDPGESKQVIEYLTKHRLKLEIILLTHCHIDHIGGVRELVRWAHSKNWQVQILGAAHLNDFGINPTRTLTEPEQFEFQKIIWNTLLMPGHTLDHLNYFSPKGEVLFCGDVLFSLGCGRLFEGSFEQGFHSLQKIKSLPKDTQIYCAHEYTLANCNFHIAEALSPQNEYLKIKQAVETRLEQSLDTVPSNLAFEIEYNCFLRAPSVEEFTQLRSKRNDFKTL